MADKLERFHSKDEVRGWSNQRHKRNRSHIGRRFKSIQTLLAVVKILPRQLWFTERFCRVHVATCKFVRQAVRRFKGGPQQCRFEFYVSFVGFMGLFTRCCTLDEVYSMDDRIHCIGQKTLRQWVDTDRLVRWGGALQGGGVGFVFLSFTLIWFLVVGCWFFVLVRLPGTSHLNRRAGVLVSDACGQYCTLNT